MSTLKLAFDMFARMGRDLSAKDLEVRLPVQVANTREIIGALRQNGNVERVGRQGREVFYRFVPGTTPPADARPDAVVKAREVRLRKFRMARMARMRKVRG